MSENVTILISSISATAKVKPHDIVLKGTSGKLDESASGTHVFVDDDGSEILHGGPVEGQLYKLHFKVAGESETIQQMKYIGHAQAFKRYIFTKTQKQPIK